MRDAVEIRFKLYPQSDRRLLERIAEQADGANQNNAVRFLMRHWFENERRQNPPQLGQPMSTPPLGQNQTNSEDDLSAALDDLEAAFGE